jgi:hypothetical protein
MTCQLMNSTKTKYFIKIRYAGKAEVNETGRAHIKINIQIRLHTDYYEHSICKLPVKSMEVSTRQVSSTLQNS